MSDLQTALNPNKLVRYLQKPASVFRRQDLVDFIGAHGIEMINFRYVAEDGKLKSLSFVINSREHLEELLTYGDRRLQPGFAGATGTGVYWSGCRLDGWGILQ